jgi:hypothetical protein
MPIVNKQHPPKRLYDNTFYEFWWWRRVCPRREWKLKLSLTLKGPKTIFKPFLKFGQAIVKAIFIKNS